MKLDSSFLRGGAVGLTLALAALIAIPTFAFFGGHQMKGPRFNPEQQQAMQDALANNDYEAWKALMEESGHMPKFFESITTENFGTFVKMQEAMKNGDRETAEQLRTQLGLPEPGRGKGGPRDGGGMRSGCSPEDRTAMDAAIESGDYAAWKALMEKNEPTDSPKLQTITEENFADFARMHALMKEGKYAEVQALRQELGLPGNSIGPRKGMMRRGPDDLRGGPGTMMQQESPQDSSSAQE